MNHSAILFPRLHNRSARAARVDVLAVGPWHEREFASALASASETANWKRTATLDEAIDQLTDSPLPPDLIVLAQPLPGSVRQPQIDRLQQLAPLTRVVVVVGSWCEGELRTGRPLTGVIRLYWYELAPWWRAALARLDGGGCPPWSVPLDGARAGRGMGHADFSAIGTPSLVALAAADRAVFETLARALETRGVGAIWQRSGETSDLPLGVTAGIWDGGQLGERELKRLTDFCRLVRARGGEVVALLDFPRAEHIELTQAAGACAVFGKPYLIDEVLAALPL